MRKVYIEEPKPIKNKDVLDFVTETDQAFIDSMPDTRKFVRLALPGEVDGQLAPLSLRLIFQNDQGALFKALIWSLWGWYTKADISQLMLINDCSFEQLFYKSYKIKMEKDVKYTDGQQVDQLFNGIVDTVCFRNPKQIPGAIWHFENTNILPMACKPIKTKTGHTLEFFNSKQAHFDASAREEEQICSPTI